MSSHPQLELHRLAEAQQPDRAGGVFLSQPVICPACCQEGTAALPKYWGNVRQPKPGQWRCAEGQLEETAPSRAARWVPLSVLISHQIVQEGTGEHPRKIYVHHVLSFGLTSRLPSPQRLVIPWKPPRHSQPGSQGCSPRGRQDSWAARLRVQGLS